MHLATSPQIALITSCGPAHFHLLPPFVEHYRRCGVGRFFINIHFDTPYPASSHEAHCAVARDILAACGESIYSIYACPFDAMSVRKHHEAIQTQMAHEFDWMVWADIDEFHEFRQPLMDLTKQMDSGGFDYVTGRFVDRMARQGFPVVSQEKSIWQQFPLGTDITRAVLKGLNEKVMLSRSRVCVIPGHHSVREGQSARVMPGILAVHHFKWDAGVTERLERRLQDDWRQRCTWWTQSERALNWMHIAPEERFPGLKVFDFEDDLMLDGGGPFSSNPLYMNNGGKAFAREQVQDSQEAPESFRKVLRT